MLLKQDRAEAILAVDGRLAFIEKEMYWPPFALRLPGRATSNVSFSERVEKQITDIQDESEKKRTAVSDVGSGWDAL